MTKPKDQALGPVGPGALVWVDTDVVDEMPALFEALCDGRGRPIVDVSSFTEWLRRPLADYRVSAAALSSVAQHGVIAAWLDRAAGDIETAIADGRLAQLPVWGAEPAVEYESRVTAGLEWRELLAYGERDAIVNCLRRAATAVRRQPSRRGRPSNKARDLLLAQVVACLRKSSIPQARRAVATARSLLDDAHDEGRRLTDIEADDFARLMLRAEAQGFLSADDARHHADLVLKCCGVPSPENSVARAARRGRGAISV